MTASDSIGRMAASIEGESNNVIDGLVCEVSDRFTSIPRVPLLKMLGDLVPISKLRKRVEV